MGRCDWPTLPEPIRRANAAKQPSESGNDAPILVGRLLPSDSNAQFYRFEHVVAFGASVDQTDVA